MLIETACLEQSASVVSLRCLTPWMHWGPWVLSIWGRSQLFLGRGALNAPQVERSNVAKDLTKARTWQKASSSKANDGTIVKEQNFVSGFRLR